MVSSSTDLDSLSPVKLALLELREMRAKLNAVERAQTEPIAIIGMGLRFPGGANRPETFWQLLRNGVDTITEIPPDRWDIKAYYDPDPTAPGKMYTRGGGFLDNVDRFDPYFFGIAPREAQSLDPQQRLLLKVSWEALEYAGQAPDKLNGSSTGVFIGMGNGDYFRLLAANPDNIDVYSVTGNVFSTASGRISYLLGLQGPSMTIDTACSSSLVAIHLACQSLRSGECDLALAGGVNLILSPEVNINFSMAQMMSAADHCKTFDADGDGYVRGEGCAAIVLKRLSDAVANGDNILALIRGSAVNQDGRSSSLTAPNGLAQEAVIRQALANAQIKPEQVNYVEAHGTGTPLGDPIEVKALAAALAEGRSADTALLIGSVKTNVGHLEAAAGIAGLIKVVLSLQRQEIPPHLNFQTPNPYIPWSKIPIKVPTQLTPWPAGEGRHIAGVSSFGFSGTNAHVILEEAPSHKSVPATRDRPLHLLTLSAKRDLALKELISRYERYLAEDERAPVAFTDICFTANTGRAHFSHRLALVAGSAAQAREKLAAFAGGEDPDGVVAGQVDDGTGPEITFLFTGHGAQYVNMGRQLYETEPTFQAALQQCEELLRPYLDQPLRQILYPEPDEPALMDRMAYAQPALFAMEYALARLWQSWGVEPTLVMGHSVGEYVAACIAGVFSLEDGLKLVATRGRLMDSLPQEGEMVAVFAAEARVAAAVAPHAHEVAIAAVNGPANIVISGASRAVQTIVASLEAEGIQTRRLAVAQAGHSPLLDPILAEFEQTAAEITYAPPQIGLISGVTGKLATAAEIGHADYWRRHLRQPVLFAAAVETLYQEGQTLFVEIGPHPTLLGMGQRCLGDAAGIKGWLPSLRRGWDDWPQILESLATLYGHGVEVEWGAFDRPFPRRRVPLPSYPWAEERYWLESPVVKQRAKQPEASARWDTWLSAGRQQAQQGPLDLALPTYPAKWQYLDRLATALIVDTFQRLGVFTQPGESHSIETLLARGHILPNYRGLMRRWLKSLAAAGLMQTEGDRFTSLSSLPNSSLEALWLEAEATLADAAPLLDYIKHCGEKLVAVLTGLESPLELLFPGGSFATATYLYSDWPVIRYFNMLARALVQSVVQTSPADKQLRVLELGAGTGGITAALLPVFPADRTTYHFTDVSNFFLGRAEEKFKAYPFIRYGLLDIEQDLETQGYQAHSFDLVVAANVLHATRDLPETLAHVLSLLAPGGLVLLLEGTNHLSWFDVTTGLIEGWGRFEDELRQDHPLLSAGQWQHTLLANGFEQVGAFPEAGSPPEILMHHVLIAQAPSTGVGTGPAFQAENEAQAQPETPLETVAVEDDIAAGFRSQLEAALPDERRELLADYTRLHVAKILRLAASHPLGRQDRLMELGLDSLMAVELRSRLGASLGLKSSLPATLVFDYPTIEAIAGYLEKLLFTANEPAAGGAINETAYSAPPSAEHDGKAINVLRLEELSEEEVATLIQKKLERL